MTNKKRSFVFPIVFWSLFLLAISFVIILFVRINNGKLGHMPDFKELENPQNNLASEIISSDGGLLGKYFQENRTKVEFDDLSPHLVNALIATEDIRFKQHVGIDLRGLGRVALRTVLMGDRTSGGGSTITQQLAKLLFHKRPESFYERVKQKLKEWVIAIKLEKSYTKEEIIAMYFNKFDFLNLAVGIKSAAKVYFNTTPESLKMEESAMLVGMVKNPAIYNPLRRPELTKARRNVVLAQLFKYNYIDSASFDSLSNLPLKIKYQKVDHKLGNATYFREFLRQLLNAHKPDRKNYPDWMYLDYKEDSLEWENNPLYGWCRKNLKPDSSHYDLYSDGLKIYTTINKNMQQYAEYAVNEHLSKDIQPEFYKEKKGASKGPFSWKLTQEQIDNIITRSMSSSERYRVLKEAGFSRDSIQKIFDTPVEMRVFSWHGEVDTVMSPLDSIKYYKYFLNSGMMSMEPQTGYVRAYVGGLDYRYFKFDHVTGARRQVGSTFKPFLYTLAMMSGGLSPCTKVPNVSVSFKMPEGQDPPIYTPKFSTSGYSEELIGKMVTLKFGLAHSMNQISAWVMDRFKPEPVIDLVRTMGVKSPLDPVYALCVGAAEVKLEEMVGAYCTFANKGIYTKPVYITTIKDKNGNTIYSNTPVRKVAISDETAYKMIELMKGVIDLPGATSHKLRYKYNFEAEIAGKTGTTNDNSDGWFIGVTPNLVTGAWVGGEYRSIRFNNGHIGQGNRLALPIWALYMDTVYKDNTLKYSQEDRFDRPAQFSDDEFKCEDEDDDNEENNNKEQPEFEDEDLFLDSFNDI